MVRSAMLAVATLALGCGSQLEPSSRLPATDRDPLPYTPAPQAEGSTDGTVSLAAAGGEDQARHMLPLFLRAARDTDARQLEALLAVEVTTLAGQRARPRAVAVQEIAGRRGLIQPDVDADRLVDLAGVRASRAAQFWHNRPPPPGVRATDIVLELPILEPGRVPLRILFNWQLRGYLVVRPGRDARIVAY